MAREIRHGTGQAIEPPSSFLDALPRAVRDQVRARMNPRRYQPGQAVIRQGEEADSLYLVKSGRVSFHFGTPSGDNVILDVFGPGEVFGEMGVLLTRHERTATAVAIDQVTMLVLPREQVDQLRREHPPVNDFLLLILAKRCDRLSRRVAEAHYVAVERRVARRLYEVGRHFAGVGTSIVLPLTQAHIAQLAGTTRPTANQVLKGLETEGILRLGRGRIELLNVPALLRHCHWS